MELASVPLSSYSYSYSTVSAVRPAAAAFRSFGLSLPIFRAAVPKISSVFFVSESYLFPRERYMCLSHAAGLDNATTSVNESAQEQVSSVVEFEEFVEKDWSFLEFDDTDTDGEHMQKIDRIITAGNIKETSKVLVSVGSESFVDRIVYSSPCEQLLVVHDSLLILACIKERHDEVKCWQGEVIDLPEKWTAFDVVYLYFLPALSFELDSVLAALAKRCLPGARVVISHPHGCEAVEEQQQQYPDVVVSSLPDKSTLHITAVNHSFQVLELVDEPGFYLSVLRFNED